MTIFSPFTLGGFDWAAVLFHSTIYIGNVKGCSLAFLKVFMIALSRWHQRVYGDAAPPPSP